VTVVTALGLYRPAWSTAAGERTPGPDEDLVTMAVAAAQAALDGRSATRVILLSNDTEAMSGPVAAVLLTALRLPMNTPVEVRVGGCAAVVEAIDSAPPGALIVAVAQSGSAAAASALVGTADAEGIHVEVIDRVERGVPAGHAPVLEEDPRFFRDRAWKPAVDRLGGRPADWPLLVVGVPTEVRVRLGSDRALSRQIDVSGAPAGLFGMASIGAAQRPARLVCLDAGSATAVDVSGCADHVVNLQRAQTVALPAEPPDGDIPVSLSAYERAFDAKVGLQAGRCECGELSLPPRDVCLSCGRERCWELRPLPHTAWVYSITTVRTKLPGMRSPYSLAVAEIDEVGVRLLAPVTDALAGTTPIGAAGRLVLRRLSLREGIADYGYAFQPAEESATVGGKQQL
jgi:uncharacterized OB-fold protein